MTKTRKEVEKLKADWKSDPCWDIETTEGFEDYYKELDEFSEKCNQEWKQKAQEKQEADPLWQAERHLEWFTEGGSEDIELVNSEAQVVTAYALVAIAKELRRANDEQEIEWEREETRRLYQ